MIYTMMGGRCGNQLFRYAITRKLSDMYPDDEVRIDYRFLERQYEADDTFIDNLKEFNCIEYEEYRGGYQPGILCGLFNPIQIIGYYLYMAWERKARKKFSSVEFYNKQSTIQKKMNRIGIYNLIQGDAPLCKSRFKNKFVYGNYENRIYYDDIRDEIKGEITPKKVTNESGGLVDFICSSESCVCVTIRRGDFLKDKERNVCDVAYFLKGIEYIKMHTQENLTFVFFSDDPDWIRKNIKIDNIRALYESGKDSIATKLFMMSQCKHFILSNSTFSWWAWYLSNHSNEQIVISPRKWFNMEGFDHPLIDKTWILI